MYNLHAKRRCEMPSVTTVDDNDESTYMNIVAQIVKLKLHWSIFFILMMTKTTRGVKHTENYHSSVYPPSALLNSLVSLAQCLPSLALFLDSSPLYSGESFDKSTLCYLPSTKQRIDQVSSQLVNTVEQKQLNSLILSFRWRPKQS